MVHRCADAPYGVHGWEWRDRVVHPRPKNNPTSGGSAPSPIRKTPDQRVIRHTIADPNAKLPFHRSERRVCIMGRDPVVQTRSRWKASDRRELRTPVSGSEL